MKTSTILIVCLLVFSIQGHGQQFTRKLEKGKTYRAPQTVVVMDTLTFAQYHFYRERFSVLREQAMMLDTHYQQQDSLLAVKIGQLQEVIKNKDTRIQLADKAYKQAYAQASKHLDDSQALDKRLQRSRQANRVWKTVSAVLAGVVIIILL